MSRSSPLSSSVRWYLNKLQGLFPCSGTIFFCWQTFKSLYAKSFLFNFLHRNNQSVGLLCDPARTSVLEISKEDGERGISKDGSGNSSAGPGHGMQWCGDCWDSKSSYLGPSALRCGLWAMGARKKWRLALSHPSFPNTLGGLAAPVRWLRESCGSIAAAVPKLAFPMLQSQL